MRHRLLFAVVASLLASSIEAGALPFGISKQDMTWVTALNIGPAWASGGESQTFSLAPDTEKTYAAKQSTNALMSSELFVGLQSSLTSKWLGQFGVAVATTSNATMQGEIWDDADSQFTNYQYQYALRQTRVAAKCKLIFDSGYWLMPWLSASIGVGFNRAHDFTNSPLIFEALPNANFTSSTTTAFTYTLSAGVQQSITHHWWVGIGYEFADWGSSELGRASGQILNSGLSLNHLYTHEMLINLTYVA